MDRRVRSAEIYPTRFPTRLYLRRVRQLSICDKSSTGVFEQAAYRNKRSMADRVQKIREASAQLDSLNKRINETVRSRDRGVQEREQWSRACAEFHAKYSELFYPGGDASLNALKRHEPGAIELGIDFLEADPLHFRSGYTKEEVWRRLRRAPLNRREGARLEQVALAYLARQIGREFWIMARVMSAIGSTEFWNAVAELEATTEEPKRTRASYLLQYRAGASAGEEFRKKLRMDRLMKKYREKQSRA